MNSPQARHLTAKVGIISPQKGQGLFDSSGDGPGFGSAGGAVGSGDISKMAPHLGQRPWDWAAVRGTCRRCPHSQLIWTFSLEAGEVGKIAFPGEDGFPTGMGKEHFPQGILSPACVLSTSVLDPQFRHVTRIESISLHHQKPYRPLEERALTGHADGQGNSVMSSLLIPFRSRIFSRIAPVDL
jgi:hypothetical protein